MHTLERVAIGGFWGLVLGALAIVALTGGPRPATSSADLAPSRLARIESVRCSHAMSTSRVFGGDTGLLGCLEATRFEARQIVDQAP
jgi:hypothetical protein